MTLVRDPGLQPERTLLAWRRTTLTFTVVALLGARQAVQNEASSLSHAAIALSALAWLGYLAVGRMRIRTVCETPAPRTLTPRTAATAAGCVLALAAFAMALVV